MNFADGPKEIKVGDTFYDVSNQYRGGAYGNRVIEAIGHKYITTGRGEVKFELETGRMKTQFCGSTAWSSKDAYEEVLLSEKYQKAFVEVIKNRKNEGTLYWVTLLAKTGLQAEFNEELKKVR